MSGYDGRYEGNGEGYDEWASSPRTKEEYQEPSPYDAFEDRDMQCQVCLYLLK